jgi:hypothetical protein
LARPRKKIKKNVDLKNVDLNFVTSCDKLELNAFIFSMETAYNYLRNNKNKTNNKTIEKMAIISFFS